MTSNDQPHEVAALAQKMLKAAGEQNPVRLMNALLLCIQLVDATARPSKEKRNDWNRWKS